MIKSRNKNRHRWIESKKYSYTYICKHCGIERIKRSAYSYEYYKDHKYYTKAPECEILNEVTVERSEIEP
jgi:hypothetical protein